MEGSWVGGVDEEGAAGFGGGGGSRAGWEGEGEGNDFWRGKENDAEMRKSRLRFAEKVEYAEDALDALKRRVA